MSLRSLAGACTKMSEWIGKPCDVHSSETVTLLCHKHAAEICNKCLQEFHKECISITNIQNEAGTESLVLTENLKKNTNDLHRILNELVMDKEKNLTELMAKRKSIGQTIKEARLRINTYLDKLTKNLEREVKSSYQKSVERVEKDKCRIEKMNDELKSIVKDFSFVEKNTTEYNISEKVNVLKSREKELETSIIRLAAEDKHIEMHLNLSESVFSFENFFFSMGSIIISERALNSSKTVERLFDQNEFQSANRFLNVANVTDAEKPVSNCETKIFGKLTLVSSFPTSKIGKGVKIFRACFLPDNTLLLAGYQEKTLYVCNKKGEECIKVRVANFPGGITLYNRTCALVSAWQHGVQKIDLADLKAGEVIKFRGECSAISSVKGQVCIKNGEDHLKVVDIKGKTIRKMPTMHNPWEICLNDIGNVFYSNLENSNVHCVFPDGSNYLTYSSPDLADPSGLTLDNQDNLYISGYRSDNIHRISSNKELSEIVLTHEDGISRPSGIVFCKQSNELLIVNDDFTSIRIYKVHTSEC